MSDKYCNAGMEDYLMAMTWMVYSRVHDGPNGPYLDEKSAVEVIREIFAAGRASALREAVEAVGSLDVFGLDRDDVLIEQVAAIAAIDKLAGEVGK